MNSVAVGCVFERLPNPRAAQALSFFEYAPRAPLPSFATLARFRKQPSARGKLALVAPKSTWHSSKGAMRPGTELDQGLEWLARAADILDAFAIVLATGAELSTGERDRALFADVVSRLKATGRVVIAAPRGLWDPEQAIPFAAQTGAVFGFDPLEQDAPPGSIVYGRVRPMGARPRLSEGHMTQIAARLIASGAESVYLSIDSEQAEKDVRRMRRTLESELLDAAVAGPDEDEDEEDEDEEDEDEEEEGEGEEGEEDEEDEEDYDEDEEDEEDEEEAP